MSEKSDVPALVPTTMTVDEALEYVRCNQQTWEHDRFDDAAEALAAEVRRLRDALASVAIDQYRRGHDAGFDEGLCK